MNIQFQKCIIKHIIQFQLQSINVLYVLEIVLKERNVHHQPMFKKNGLNKPLVNVNKKKKI